MKAIVKTALVLAVLIFGVFSLERSAVAQGLEYGEVAADGPYMGGKRHGHWVIVTPDAGIFQGQSFFSGVIIEGPMTMEGTMIDGKSQGHWVARLTTSEGPVTAEGTLVDGEMQGHWVYRSSDGTVHEGSYVNGEEHGLHITRNDNEGGCLWTRYSYGIEFDEGDC